MIERAERCRNSKPAEDKHLVQTDMTQLFKGARARASDLHAECREGLRQTAEWLLPTALDCSATRWLLASSMVVTSACAFGIMLMQHSAGAVQPGLVLSGERRVQVHALRR